MEWKMNRMVCGSFITAEARRIGNDFAVTVYGGTKIHVGSVSIAGPGHAAVSMVLPSHMDNVIGEIYANKFTKEFGCNTSVTCGIHYENPTRKDLNDIVHESEILLGELIERIKVSER